MAISHGANVWNVIASSTFQIAQIFVNNNSEKTWSPHKVFGLENYDEELYFPSVIYNLDKNTELKRLIFFYSAILEISKENIASLSKNYNLLYIFSFNLNI